MDCQVLDSDISPCRTGSSSVTSGDLADISSLSSKASSLQHSSGGTSGSMSLGRPDFIMPPSRGAKSIRYCLQLNAANHILSFSSVLSVKSLSALSVCTRCMLFPVSLLCLL